MSAQDHWEHIHATKADAVSWYQPASTESLRLIQACALPPGAPVLDVGAGASVLVDQLLDLGLRPTVLELAEAALTRVKERLGDRARGVGFIIGDVTRAALPEGGFDLWHDRAVFHFLTDPADRAAYVAQVRRALRPGGFVVLSGFALDGPLKCSGLEVRRHDAAGFAAELGPGFELLEEAREVHSTPFGTTQAFQYTRFRKG